MKTGDKYVIELAEQAGNWFNIKDMGGALATYHLERLTPLDDYQKEAYAEGMKAMEKEVEEAYERGYLDGKAAQKEPEKKEPKYKVGDIVVDDDGNRRLVLFVDNHPHCTVFYDLFDRYNGYDSLAEDMIVKAVAHVDGIDTAMKLLEEGE